MEVKVKLASQEAADRYSESRKRARSRNTRTKKGELTSIINECKAKHSIPDNIKIEPECIRSRVKRGKHHGGISGNTSPMVEIEPYLVELMQQLEKMRVPISCRQGLALANSIISGTSHEARVLAWKEKHCFSFKTGESNNNLPLLGKGYWANFLKRNSHVITTKKGVKFDSKRADWCTYKNFEVMYQEVYEQMVECGVATKLDDEVWFNKAGDIVDDETDAFGLKSRYFLLHPSKVIFVDEVGNNTSQSNDGNVGGEKFICSAGGRPQQRANMKDAHFTVLGFTSATGQPLMCSIIFACKELEPIMVQGLDPFTPWEGNDNDLERNTGPGKRHPQGPQVQYNGVTVPCFCACSESGSITGELLAEMLRFIDKLNIFDRSDQVLPFLLLDGHGSRFELAFLEYITNKNNEWKVCIGVPYGTSYWQVGDSTEQNGCFKMALAKSKRELVDKKENAGVIGTIEKTDIVGLVTCAWNQSFARVASNKKAVAERGWGPLTYNLLLHPEINLDKNSQSKMQHSNIDPSELNFTKGISGSLTEKIVLFRAREAARTGENATEMLLQRKKTAEEAIAKGRRLTAGLHVATGNFCIGPDCLKNIQEKIRKEEEKRYQGALKLKEDYDKILAEVEAIKLLNKAPEQWSVGQLRTMVKWYKRDDSDKALPNKKADLLVRYHETCRRGDRAAPTLPSAPVSENPHLELSSSRHNEDRETSLLDPISIEHDDDDDEDIVALAV